jgi:hypothetical protein
LASSNRLVKVQGDVAPEQLGPNCNIILDHQLLSDAWHLIAMDLR